MSKGLQSSTIARPASPALRITTRNLWPRNSVIYRLSADVCPGNYREGYSLKRCVHSTALMNEQSAKVRILLGSLQIDLIFEKLDSGPRLGRLAPRLSR